MQITLTYTGPLPSAQQGRAADAKSQLRNHFHYQLQSLWKKYVTSPDDEEPSLDQVVSVGGLEFGHLIVEEKHGIGIRLSVLLLARAGTLREGDLDNRLKTLTDALAIPANGQQVSGGPDDPGRRIICLMRDDTQVKSISVDRREWLEPRLGEQYNDVQLVVTGSTFAVGPITYGGISWIG